MSYERDEHMRVKNILLQRRNISTWCCLFVAGAPLLLAASGGDTTPSTNAAVTPTPTIAQPTLTQTPGSTQVVLIVTESNGSFGFSPAALSIRVGTTVIWKNRSSAPHTITSYDRTSFDSGTIAVGGTFRHTFTNTGTFPYPCNYHPYMRATISR
jgi:plastocyanin